MTDAAGSRVLFIVPSGDFLPSGIVRVRQFLPFLDRARIAHTVVSYYSPGADRFVAGMRSNTAPRPVQSLAIGAAALFQMLVRWWTRVRVLLVAARFDVIFFQGVLPPVWYIKLLKTLNQRIVLDMDDAIFLGNPERGAAVMPLMWQVIAGSHFILDYARAHGARAALVPSAVSVDRYNVAAADATPRRGVRVGWLGSESTVQYLQQLVAPLAELARHGHEIELMVDGVAPRAAGLPEFPGITVTCAPAYRDEDIPSIVGRYDIGVMPLADGPWERGKCAMKALIYMAAGKPAVCSRVGENSFVIDDHVNGFLASSEAEWTEKLGTLINDPRLRIEVGRRGRKTAEERYSSDVCFSLLWANVFGRLGAGEGNAL